jgi:thiol:disulfide interchange protein DsbC
MVQGTPAIIFADGTRVNGALPLDDLQRKLDTLN